MCTELQFLAFEIESHLYNTSECIFVHPILPLHIPPLSLGLRQGSRKVRIVIFPASNSRLKVLLNVSYGNRQTKKLVQLEHTEWQVDPWNKTREKSIAWIIGVYNRPGHVRVQVGISGVTRQTLKCNVTWRSVCSTIAVVDRQWVLHNMSVCVCVCIFVALGIQHVMCMHHITVFFDR